MRYFAPFIFLLLLVALFLRVEFFFTILYFLVAVRVLSQFWMRRVIEGLRGGRRFVNRAFTGDRVPVRLTVRNGSALPLLWLEVDEALPLGLRSGPFERQVVSLGGHEAWSCDYALTCQRRGRYVVGPTTLRAGDPLGIARQDLRWGGTDELIVYPRVVPLEHLGLPSRSPLATLPTASPLFEDPSRIMSVRDYRRGDPFRRVHWPATARTGHLVVKQFQPAIARETMLCLDLAEGDYAARYRYDAVELAIVVAASLANHIVVREGLAVGLTTQARDLPPGERIARGAAGGDPLLPPRRERAHLVHILETLAVVELTTDPARAPFTDLLHPTRLGLSWGATVVVITGRGGPALSDALLQLRRSGLAVTVILVGVARITDGAPDWAPPPGVRVHLVRTPHDLEVLA